MNVDKTQTERLNDNEIQMTQMSVNKVQTKRIKFQIYKGKTIFYTDYRGLTDDEEIESFIEEITKVQLEYGKPTRQLTNVEGVFFTPRVMKAVNKAAPVVKNYIIKDAIVGVKGIKRIIFQAYNTLIGGNARAFKTEQEAKTWLIRD